MVVGNMANHTFNIGSCEGERVKNSSSGDTRGLASQGHKKKVYVRTSTSQVISWLLGNKASQSFRPTAIGCPKIIILIIRNRLDNGHRYEFLFISFDSFLFCSYIATKCVCKISKGHVQWFWSYMSFGRKSGELPPRYEFLFVSFDSFFILFLYSYEMHLQNFKRPR